MDYSINIKEGQIALTKKTSRGVVLTSVKEVFLELKDGRYIMIIKRILKTRTVEQNKYYWACLGLIAVEVGYIIDEMDKDTKKAIVEKLHELFKERFIGKTVIRSVKDKRKRLTLDPTTTNMDTKEFAQYMDKIRVLHPYLPDPSDKHLLEFIDQYYYR